MLSTSCCTAAVLDAPQGLLSIIIMLRNILQLTEAFQGVQYRLFLESNLKTTCDALQFCLRSQCKVSS